MGFVLVAQAVCEARQMASNTFSYSHNVPHIAIQQINS